MSTMKFVKELPPKGKTGMKPLSESSLVEALKTRPGEWAEVERRTKADRSNLNAKGARYVKSVPGIEKAVRSIGKEAILFMRYVPPTDWP